MWNKIKPYLLPVGIGIAVSLGVGALAAILTRGSMNIYEALNTPPMSPPSILFPIVWSALYILMGVSAALVWVNRFLSESDALTGLKRFALSLVFNFAWSIIFFNLRSPLAAFVCLVVLLYLIIKTIISYRRVLPIAAYLQIPYAVWVLFAGYLNLGIYFLN
jgi:tryptophan-rich sensory protein